MSACARAGMCVCEGSGGRGGGGGFYRFFPTRIQYRSESNTDLIFSIIL